MQFFRSKKGLSEVSKANSLTAGQIEDFMISALAEAEKAFKKGDVPIGCIIVHNERIIARAHNLKEKKQDCTAHAEMLAIRKASKKLKNWRLNDCILFTTVEPCIMCSGAIYHARISAVYYGCNDHKFGGYGSLTDVNQLKTNHRVKVHSGILADRSAALLKDFFKDKRK